MINFQELIDNDSTEFCNSVRLIEDRFNKSFKRDTFARSLLLSRKLNNKYLSNMVNTGFTYAPGYNIIAIIHVYYALFAALL